MTYDERTTLRQQIHENCAQKDRDVLDWYLNYVESMTEWCDWVDTKWGTLSHGSWWSRDTVWVPQARLRALYGQRIKPSLVERAWKALR